MSHSKLIEGPTAKTALDLISDFACQLVLPPDDLFSCVARAKHQDIQREKQQLRVKIQQFKQQALDLATELLIMDQPGLGTIPPSFGELIRMDKLNANGR